MKYSIKDFIKSIQEGREDILLYFYRHYHPKFFGWAKSKFSVLSYQDIEGVYDEAWIIVVNKIKEEKIKIVGPAVVGLWVPLLVFLKSIAKRFFLNELKMRKKQIAAEQNFNELDTTPTKNHLDKEEIVSQAFKLLKLRWQRLLYYRLIMGLEYDFIAKILPAKNGNVVKTEKNRASNKLRTHYLALIKQQPNNNGRPSSDTDEDSSMPLGA